MDPNLTLLFPQFLEHGWYWLSKAESQRGTGHTQVVHTSQSQGTGLGGERQIVEPKRQTTDAQHTVQNSDSIFPHLSFTLDI